MEWGWDGCEGADVRGYRAYIWGGARLSWFGAHIHPIHSFRAYMIHPRISRRAPIYPPLHLFLFLFLCPFSPSAPSLCLFSIYVLTTASLEHFPQLRPQLLLLLLLLPHPKRGRGIVRRVRVRVRVRVRGGGDWERDCREGGGEVRLFPVFNYFFWRKRIHRLSLRLSTCIPTPRCHRSSFPSLLFAYIHIRV
ncbi:hypothetical protein B0H14DRAFT_1634526 [Mycena olivaceomarginata]|nr:hypothetical protein B0H14DRAFT_1634526 [Mycena olivaceomarginata]